MKQLTKNEKTILLHLAGTEIEFRDKNKFWIKLKDKHLEDIDKGHLTRRTAVKAYTALRHLIV